MKIDTTKIIDISMDLNENTIVWKEDKPPQLKPVARIPDAPVNFTWLDFGSHAGTHVDAPYYLYSDKWTADQIPFDRLIGVAQVLDMTDINDMITKKDLMKKKIKSNKVLIKTQCSYDPMEAYNPNHVAMNVESAEYLIEQGVTTVGYDYQSFEHEGKNEIHTVFLSKSITLLDNLRLKNTEEKLYYMIALPVKVTGIDAAPTRAILIDN